MASSPDPFSQERRGDIHYRKKFPPLSLGEGEGRG
jgi:hypothetical protein